MSRTRLGMVLLPAIVFLSVVLVSCSSPSGSSHTTYTLTIVAGAGGSTVPSGALTVQPGVATSIQATAAAGHIWGYWTVTSGTPAVSNLSSSSITVTLYSGDATVQANFP